MKLKMAVAILALTLVTVACAGAGQSQGSGGRPTGTADQGPATIEVQAEDFKFGGVPQTVPAGPATFTLENVGQEPHEFGVARIRTDTPIEELVQLPGKEVNQQIEQLGGTFAKPGETGKPFEADLTPGRYGYVCFVMTKGKPHAALGMYGEFEVV